MLLEYLIRLDLIKWQGSYIRLPFLSKFKELLSMGCNVAIAGVTGAVGQEFLSIIEERDFPFDSIKMLASTRSAGKTIQFKGKEYVVEQMTDKSFDRVDIALFSAGADRSKTFAPAAVKAGAVVVDNSSAFRMTPDVPLVIPEINPQMIKEHKGIIANPNCSTIIGIVPVWPLHKANPVKRMVVSTYQAASGAGQAAMLELEQQAREILAGKKPTIKVLPYQLAFNVFSHNSCAGLYRLQPGRSQNGQRDQEDFRLPGYRDYRDLHSRGGFAGTQREHQP